MNRVDYQLYGARAIAARGEMLPQSKLDADRVRDIRANVRGLTAKQLAVLHGVHHRTIEKVRHFETWTHV